MNETEEKTYRELIITKLDNLDEKIDTVKQDGQDTLRQSKEANHRISKLEQWRSYMLGAFGVLAVFLVSILVPLIDAFIKAGKIF